MRGKKENAGKKKNEIREKREKERYEEVTEKGCAGGKNE